MQDMLLQTCGVHDSCGIHNLHGMPSVLGGIVSAVVPMMIQDSNAGETGSQLSGVAATLVVALVTGAVTGQILRPMKDANAALADDSAYWVVADDFGKEV